MVVRMLVRVALCRVFASAAELRLFKLETGRFGSVPIARSGRFDQLEKVIPLLVRHSAILMSPQDSPGDSVEPLGIFRGTGGAQG